MGERLGSGHWAKIHLNWPKKRTRATTRSKTTELHKQFEVRLKLAFKVPPVALTGKTKNIPTKCDTKTAARRLAREFEQKIERQKLGLDPMPVVRSSPSAS